MNGKSCYIKVVELDRYTSERQLLIARPTALWAVTLALCWTLVALVLSGRLLFAEDKIQLTLVFAALYAYPGFLTAEILRLRTHWSRVQTLALACGIGVAEALLIGQAALTLELPTTVLGHAATLLAGVKLIYLLARRPSPPGFAFPDGASTAQIAIALAGLLLLINNVRFSSVYSWQPPDAWNYLQVQAQFSDNPGAMNLQPGITAYSVNLRLLWSSWLYNRSALTDIAAANPVTAHQRDGLIALYGMAVLVYAALGRELLHDRQAAWLAAFMQAGLAISASGNFSSFTIRLVEDKFFSYYIFIPIIFMLLLRIMQRPTRTLFSLFIFLSVAMTLIHPVNSIALFLTALPFMGYHWSMTRQPLFWKTLLPLTLWLSALLLYPVMTQITLANLTVSEPRPVSAAMETSRSVSWFYTLDVPVIDRPDRGVFDWSYARQQPDFILSTFILLPVMLVAAVRISDDLAVHFIGLVSLTILLLLWVPPFAALGAIIMTQSQNWRIFMLLPVGYGWAWLALKLRERIEAQFSAPRRSVIRIPWGITAVVVIILLGGWFGRVPDGNYSSTMSKNEIAAFAAGRDLVGSGTVLSTDQLSRVIPTLWPDARTPFAGRRIPDQAAYNDLMAAVNLNPGDDPQRVLIEQKIGFLLLPHTAPLAQVIEQGWSCCDKIYENDDLALYRVRPEIPVYDAAQ